MIKKIDGLGIKVPSSDFCVSDVEKYVGENVYYMYMHMCGVLVSSRCIYMCILCNK